MGDPMTRPLSANDRAIKEKELKWFKACQNLCPLFPPDEPEQNPSHARKPDIVFHHIGLGIEITEYLPKNEGGSSLRRSEVLRDRLLQEAKKTFERSSNEQVVVLVSWDPHQQFSSITKTGVAEQIAGDNYQYASERRELVATRLDHGRRQVSWTAYWSYRRVATP